MFDNINGIMQAWAKKKTQWTEALYVTVMCGKQKRSKYRAEESLLMDMLLISVHKHDPSVKMGLVW